MRSVFLRDADLRPLVSDYRSTLACNASIAPWASVLAGSPAGTARYAASARSKSFFSRYACPIWTCRPVRRGDGGQDGFIRIDGRVVVAAVVQRVGGVERFLQLVATQIGEHAGRRRRRVERIRLHDEIHPSRSRSPHVGEPLDRLVAPLPDEEEPAPPLQADEGEAAGVVGRRLDAPLPLRILSTTSAPTIGSPSTSRTAPVITPVWAFADHGDHRQNRQEQ